MPAPSDHGCILRYLRDVNFTFAIFTRFDEIFIVDAVIMHVHNNTDINKFKAFQG